MVASTYRHNKYIKKVRLYTRFLLIFIAKYQTDALYLSTDMATMTLSEELAWRGFVNQTTYTDTTVLDGDPISFYWGVDPSADSMTIGNLAAAMMVKCFMKHGHKPVLLVGGATGMIGDPDGKREERNLKSLEEIARNKAAITQQYRQIFADFQFESVDNYDWFKDKSYLNFLREVGKHVPMRQMLSREFVQTRLGEGGAGVSYAEFSYVLIQAYDFLRLYEDKGVTLQVCGSDQWGNSIAGVDLIRRKTGGEAHVYSTPLIVNKATGVKFGKSEDGAIWLDANKTSPTQFYQFWINVDDGGVEGYLKVYTELDQPEIEEILRVHQENPAERHAQKSLAYAVTALVHGEAAAKVTQTVTDVLTGKVPIGAIDADTAQAISREQPQLSVTDITTTTVSGVLCDTGLAASRTEARRLLEGFAVTINGEKITRDSFEPHDFQNGRLLLRKGKKFKDSALVELQS